MIFIIQEPSVTDVSVTITITSCILLFALNLTDLSRFATRQRPLPDHTTHLSLPPSNITRWMDTENANWRSDKLNSDIPQSFLRVKTHVSEAARKFLTRDPFLRVARTRTISASM